MSPLMRVLSLFFVILYFGITSLVIYKTFGDLPPKEKLSFLYILPCFGLFLLGIIFRNLHEQKQIKSIRKENDRFLSMYDEIKELHLFQKKQSMTYWNWVVGALIFGWTLYHFFEVFSPSIRLHPGVAGGIFFAAFLVATRGIEKQKVVDEKLINTTIKGLQIESRLARSKYHYFSHFVKTRRGIRLVFFLTARTAPILLIVLPLTYYSLIPIMGVRIPCSPLFFVGAVLGISFLALGSAILIPYLKLFKRCKLRVNVLQ